MKVINQNLPLAPRDHAWDASAADKRVRTYAGAEEKPTEKYCHAFFYCEGDGSEYGDYKLPYADVVDGKLMAVPKAIFAVAGALDGARGGLDIPEADKDHIKAQVNKYYAKMREEFKDETLKAPWDKNDEKAAPIEEQRTDGIGEGVTDKLPTIEAAADSADTQVRAAPAEKPAFKREANEILFRDAEFDLRTVDTDKRTVDLSFSSETPVDRFYGQEILDHSKGSVNLKRLNAGAPLLLNHDPDQHIGVVEKASVGGDKKGRATVRFGRSQLASDAFQDVQDGIRRGVSVGYRTHDDPEPEDVKGGKAYRFKNWEPLEISLASVPADASIGVGRTIQKTISTGDRTMPEPQIDVAAERAAAQAAERDRVRKISEAGEKLAKLAPNIRGLADKAIREGTDVQAFMESAFGELETAGHATRAPSAEIGLSDKEAQDFSIVRLIQHFQNPKDKAMREAAAFELEASEAARTRYKTDRGSFTVPYDVMRAKRIARLEAQRDLSYSGGTTSTVATNLLAADFIDILRNATKVKQMGATVLGGLVGNVAIPRQSGAASAFWVSTDTTALTESDQTFDQVTLAVHNVTGMTKYSRQLLLQSTPDLEGLVRNDLARILAIAADLAAISGTGSSGQPTGILNTGGINSVALGTNGAAPTWTAVADMVGKLIQSNAYFGRLGWLTNGQVWETLVTTAKIGSTYPTFILDDDADSLFKAPFETSQQVPSNLVKGTSGAVCSALIFANWADLIIGEWGGVDILVDPYTYANAQETAIYAYQSMDIKTRHPLSFCAITDMLTT